METTLLSAFEEFLLKIGGKNRPYSPGVLVAATPGRDSVVLCHLMKEIKALKGIVHFNFGLHSTDRSDEQFVRKLAEKLEVPFHLERFDTRTYAALWDISHQTAVRRLRYAWLDTIRRRENAEYVATAFNGEEALELLFINMAKGSGLTEMTSPPPRNGWLMRPLMFATREEIAQYAEEKELEYLDDHYELHEDSLHTKVREQVMPAMASLNPAFHKNIRQTLERWQGFADMIKPDPYYNRLNWNWRSQTLDYYIHSLDYGLKDIEKIYQAIKGYGFTYEQATKISQTAQEYAPYGRTKYAYLSETHRASISNGRFTLYEVREVKMSLQSLDYSPIQFPNGLLSIEYHKQKPEGRYYDKNTLYLDAGKVTWPLRFSRWRPEYQFHSPTSHFPPQDLNTYFKNRNIDGISRENYWLIWSGEDICCIAGLQEDKRFLPGPEGNGVLAINFYHTVDADREY